MFNIKDNFKIIYLSTDKANLNSNEIFIYNYLIKYLIKVDLFVSNTFVTIFLYQNLSLIYTMIFMTLLSQFIRGKKLKNKIK